MKILKCCKLAIIMILLASTPLWASEAGQDQGWNFFLRLINFAVFIGILFFFARKPIAKALRNRQEKVKQELDHLEASREESARAKTEAQELLLKAQEESKRLLVEYRNQAEAERLRLMEQAEQQIKHMYEQAKLTIEREMVFAQEKLKQELALAAVSAAEEMLRKQINLQDQVRLNQAFIVNLAKEKAGAK